MPPTVAEHLGGIFCQFKLVNPEPYEGVINAKINRLSGCRFRGAVKCRALKLNQQTNRDLLHLCLDNE